MTNQAVLFEMALVNEIGITAEAHRVLPGMPVKLFAQQNWQYVQAGISVVSGADATSGIETVISMHNPDLPRTEGTDLTFIGAVVIADCVKDVEDPQTFHTNNDVPATSGDILSSEPYAWERQAMLPLLTASMSSHVYHGSKYGPENEIIEVQHFSMSVDYEPRVAVPGPNFCENSYK